MPTTREQSIGKSAKDNHRPEGRTQDKNRAEERTEEGLARAAVVYQSKAKARSREAEETSYKVRLALASVSCLVLMDVVQRGSSGLSGTSIKARSESNPSGRKSNTSGSRYSSTGRAFEGVRFSCFRYG